MSSPSDVNIRYQLFEFSESGQRDANHIPADRWIDMAASEDIHIEQRSLDKIFGVYCFKIPEYQRGYAWEEQQLEDLWAELEPLFENDIQRFTIEDTFFGSVFFAETGTDPDSGRDVLEIIDGQQRITTISIILKILSEELSAIDQAAIEDEELQELHGSYQTVIKQQIFNDIEPAHPDPALTLSGHNDSFYQALLKGESERIEFIRTCESVHGNRKQNAIKTEDYRQKLRLPSDAIDPDNVEFQDTNNLLIEAYDFFRTRLSNELPSAPLDRTRALINLHRYLMKCFIVGFFIVDRGRPALLMDIFQILNDRGMDLNKVEIIRARIVACFRDDGLDDSVVEEYLGKWEAIVDQFDVDYDIVGDLLIDYITINEPDVSARTEVSDNL